MFAPTVLKYSTMHLVLKMLWDNTWEKSFELQNLLAKKWLWSEYCLEGKQRNIVDRM